MTRYRGNGIDCVAARFRPSMHPSTRCCDSRVKGRFKRATIGNAERFKKACSLVEIPTQCGRIPFTLYV